MTNQEFLFDLATHENSNTEQTLHNTLVAATLQLDMNHGFISSLQENHTVLYSYPHHYQGSVITQLAEPLFTRALTTNKVFTYSHEDTLMPVILDGQAVHRFIAAPIIFKGEVAGILAFCQTRHCQNQVFSKDTLKFVMALSRWVSGRLTWLEKELRFKSALDSVINHALQAMMLVEKTWNPQSNKPDFRLVNINSVAQNLLFGGKSVKDHFFFELMPELKPRLFGDLDKVLETKQPYITSLRLPQKAGQSLHLSCVKVNNQLVLSCLLTHHSLTS